MTEFDRKLDGVKGPPKAPPPEAGQAHPQQKKAMELFARFSQNRHMGMSFDIHSLANKLKAPVATTQFPEQLFVSIFIPLFAGEVPDPDAALYNTWIDKVAGGEFASVEIIDANKQVLFTVPPMFEKSVLDTAKPGGNNMTRVERTYNRLKEFAAKDSQVFLRTSLESIHIKEKPTPEVYANIRVWNSIFERYGKKDKIVNLMPLGDDPNPQAAPLASTSNKNDLSDYTLDTD